MKTEKMTLMQCKDYLDEHGHGAADYPTDRNPFEMKRSCVIEELENTYGTACYDSESDELLEEALAENMAPVEEWRDAVTETKIENGVEEDD